MSPRLSSLILRSGIGWLPVKIRRGPLRGYRWTLWPHSAYWRGDYEPEIQATLLRHAPARGGVAWDLGAHFGFHSLLLAQAVGPAGQVCAFEPDPVSHARLSRHMVMNRLQQVRTYPLGISDHCFRVRLVQSEGPGATTSHFPTADENSPARSTAEIEVATLDHVRTRHDLRLPQLLKIDVEGHAGAALRGAQATLRACRPPMLVSVHSEEESAGIRAATEPLDYAPAGVADEPLAWSDIAYRTVWLRAH